MDEYSIGSPRDASARLLGQASARAFFDDPVEGATMESFVVGDVTGEIVRLTRSLQKAKLAQIKTWRRQHFLAPIALAVLGVVTAIATTPRAGSNVSSLAPVIGVLGIAAGIVWLIVNAFRASTMLAGAQDEREAETGHLLTVAREAAAATYADLVRGGGARTGRKPEGDAADAAAADDVAEKGGTTDADDADDAGAKEASDASTENNDNDEGKAEDEDEADAPADQAPPLTAEEEDEAIARAREQRRAAGAPPPAGQPFGVSQEGAEYLVVAWMRHLGEADAATTAYSATGGLDAVGSRCVAKVKNDSGDVDAEEVQSLLDAAAGDSRLALFFASGPYEDEAQGLAEQTGVALFTYDAVEGTLAGANPRARQAMIDGLK